MFNLNLVYSTIQVLLSFSIFMDLGFFNIFRHFVRSFQSVPYNEKIFIGLSQETHISTTPNFGQAHNLHI